MEESLETHHSLEDWIAFRSDIFNDVNNKCDKLCFLVAYNEIETEVAITCIESTRRATDRTPKSMACSLSLQSLQNLNQQLSLVRPEVNQHFVAINEFIDQQNSTLRLFAFNFGYGPKSLNLNEEKFCQQIQHYLDSALLLCGRKLLLAVLFEVDFLSDFEENIQELRLKGFENLLNNTMKELNEVINLRSNAETLLEMTTIYVIEDEVIANVSIALAELYNFQLQPFLQLRELAYNDIEKAKNVIKNPDLGERVKNEAQKQLNEAKEQYLSSTEALQQLYQEYYRKTVELVNGQTERMRSDQNRFGQSAFEVKGALTRLQKLELFLSQEKLKLLNSIKITKEFQRDQIQEQLSGSSSNSDLQRIESDIYGVQISVLDSKLDIIFEEEKLIKQKIVILQTNMQNEDNIQFFDAIEDEEELKTLDFNPENDLSSDRNKLSSLKTKLNNLYRKRAFLRNKRKSLISEKKKRQMKTTNEKVNYEKHHKVNPKRNCKLHEDKKTDKKADEKFNEIRRQTLQRLKNYKLKSLLHNASDNAFNRNESDDSDHKLSLPPYPESIGYFNDRQKEFPLPPPEFLNDIPKSTEQSINLNETQLSATICPPLPPPSLPPPPPPPPPSSLFSASLQSTKLDINIKKKDSNQQLNNESQNRKGFSGLIDLNEILKMKNKLKPVQVKEEVNGGNGAQDTLLHATLNRIRTIVEDSDVSEDNSFSESEFD